MESIHEILQCCSMILRTKWPELDSTEGQSQSQLLNDPSGGVLNGPRPGSNKWHGPWARVRSLCNFLGPGLGLGPFSKTSGRIIEQL